MNQEKRVLMVSADHFEDTELLVPKYRLEEAGYTVDIAAPQAGTIKGKHGYEVEANLSVDEVEDAGSRGYSMLILPGGKAPATLREIPRVLEIARDFASAGLPIAAICHGPQILISAGLLQGRKATAYESVQPELKEADVQAMDQELVTDGQFVTSRQPSDLPAFNREIMQRLAQVAEPAMA